LRPRIALVATLALVAATVQAQTVDEVVARHLDARGGAARIKALTSLRMSGSMTGPQGRRALVLREVQRPGRIRTEFTFQGVTGVFVCDGADCWQVSPFDGTFDPEAMPEAKAQLARDLADLDGPLLDWKARGSQVTLVGKSPVGGRPAYVLEVKPKDGPVRRLSIDAETWQLVASEADREVRGHRVRLQTIVTEQATAGGVVFPKRLELGIEGRPQKIKVAVDTIEVDVPLDAARFKKPAVP